jgi:glycosyltransferase involved in cell wall biosynthesis
LWILGTGPLESSLRGLASSLGIADRVRFLGFKKNPYPYMRSADCFVLSSAWEGFGNVLVEAMICGTPVVATRCSFGPEEIIDDRHSGLLVDCGDSQGLGEAIECVLGNHAVSRGLAHFGRERAKRFMPSIVVRDYERLFSKVAFS